MLRVEKPCILLADDNEATCTLITALLHREFTVDVAVDGQEAIDRLRTRRYAAVLLDLRMPLTDGFAVLEFLKEHQPRTLTNVLVVTAALTDNEVQRAGSYGVCAIVPKPFELETLLAAVKACALPDEGSNLGPVLCSSGPMILLLADLLRQNLM
ncbi:MAG TPA: response regulator transcription factor [Thermoanaerobaculia bacterium]|nr:response regulator transcription factor [Thermoanaerobaculia bacterium]